ncbi:MAG: hypothetical protein ACPHM6_07660 [Paracoccaceae bacterium]
MDAGFFEPVRLIVRLWPSAVCDFEPISKTFKSDRPTLAVGFDFGFEETDLGFFVSEIFAALGGRRGCMVFATWSQSAASSLFNRRFFILLLQPPHQF